MTTAPGSDRLLTILAGNSTLRWIVWEGDAVADRGEEPTSAVLDAGAPARLTQGLRGAGRVVLASVNEPVAARVRAAAGDDGPVVEVFGDTLPNPLLLSPAMTHPEQIGRDRLVASYAAWRLAGEAPVVVVDVGTAITVNAVNADGEFEGGTIAVGPHLAAQALAQGTEQLPLAPAAPATHALGKNTAEALAAGISLGLGGMVRALVAAARAELRSGPVTVFATGGGLARLTGLDGVVDRVEPDLALIGLRLAAVC